MAYGEQCATLGEVIKHLETLPQDMQVAKGFGEAESYRGYYEDVAFEPVADTTVGDMLGHARSALGQTFEGYKGGNKQAVAEYTDCWIARWGETGLPMVVPGPDDMEFYVLPFMEEGE